MMVRYLSYLSFVFLVYLVNSAKASSEFVSRVYWQFYTLTAGVTSVSGRQSVIDLFRQYLPLKPKGTFTFWDMVQIAALCGAIPGIWYLQRRLRRKDSDTASWMSTSTLKKGVAVNEDDSGGKFIPIALEHRSC